jgi:ABC-type lipoprotein release transport system permease subunit
MLERGYTNYGAEGVLREAGILSLVGTLESLWVALDTLRTHKLRSFLTMLGVIFGVMAVVVMVALIEGARASVVQEFEKLGSDVIIVAFDPSERIRRAAAPPRRY